MTSASTPELVDLVHDESLPSPPAVASEVLRLTRDEGVSLDELAAVLSRDPALSAKLLKLANSSLFPSGNPVASLEAAVLRLGLKTVKLMALSFSLVGGLKKGGENTAVFDYGAFWRRSLTQAVAARAFAGLVGSRAGEEAFLAGILGRIGQLAMNEVIPERYEQVITAAADMFPCAVDERAILGFDHHELGGALLERWELPDSIVAAVRHGGEPAGLPVATAPAIAEIVRLVHVGIIAATVLCEPRKGAAMQSLQEAAAAFGVPSVAVDDYLLDLQRAIRDAARVLDIDIGPQRTIAEIVNEARLQMVQISLGTALDLRSTEDRAARLERDKIELEHRANTDRLTGIANRGRFETHLARELARIREDERLTLAFLLIDVDRFKAFNDVHGHAAGDEVLRAVARELQAATPPGALAARYGGEEFVVVTTGLDEAELLGLAERLRTRVAACRVTHAGRDLAVTISVGGAVAPGVVDEPRAKNLLELADACLYEAKNAGRNRSVCRAVHPSLI